MKIRVIGVTAVLALAGGALGDVVLLNPSADASIYDTLDPTSNSLGSYIFCGNNGSGEARRGFLKFDVSGIPAGSTVTAVTLKLRLTRAASFSGIRQCSIRRVTHRWAEGPSQAVGNEGGGALAGPGDPTWGFAAYNTDAWATPGGDMVAAASATVGVDETQLIDYTWGSTAQMVADVQGWLGAPTSNFGWALRGDEAAAGTARRFASRENIDTSIRPRLAVTYTPPTTGGCYANCDGSTQPPVANVADFTCFLQKFAANDPYANCDGSTTPPVVNVGDFTCFLQKFAAGCSAP
jgi:hypothetical protein